MKELFFLAEAGQILVSKSQPQVPRLTRKELESLLENWSAVAKLTLDCPTCDQYYQTPFEWLDEPEKKSFIDHLYETHLHPKPVVRKRKI